MLSVPRLADALLVLGLLALGAGCGSTETPTSAADGKSAEPNLTVIA